LSLFSGKRNEGESSEGNAGTTTPSTTPQADSARRSSKKQGRTSVANIGKSITIRGDLTGNEDLVIEGQVEGKIELPNNQLTIGENGNVKAHIDAKSVVVVGHVIGNVTGLERVEIQATGKVDGDVTAPKLIVAEGAQVNGAIQMNSQRSGQSAGAQSADQKTSKSAAPKLPSPGTHQSV
jgi:cytoskeletal protein CcmA (bactofilin family)